MSSLEMLQNLERTLNEKKQEQEQRIQEEVNQITDKLMETLIKTAESRLKILEKNYTDSLRTSSTIMQQLTERVEHTLQMIDTRNIEEIRFTAKAIEQAAIIQVQKVGEKNKVLTAITSCTLTAFLMLIVYLLFIKPHHTKELQEIRTQTERQMENLEKLYQSERLQLQMAHSKQIRKLKEQITSLQAKLGKKYRR